MTPGSQTGSPAVTRFALGGLAVGAAVSSLLGAAIFAGFAAVALAVGVVMALESLLDSGRVLAVLAGLLTMLFPLAVASDGEGGILWAAAVALMVLAAGYVLRRQRPGALVALAVSLGLVLHLGLTGSFLVLVAAGGNRLLPALILMAAAFEVVYLVVSARGGTPAEQERGKAPGRGFGIDPRAALAGLAACQAAALGSRIFLPSPPGVVSSLVLGAVVASGALVGRLSAAAIAEDLGSRAGGRSSLVASGVIPHLNALLFAAGAFYYGFRLYLT